MAKTWVLVTGASTGIGEATALHLDRFGFRVLAGVRREEDGDRLKASASERLRPIILDVTDKQGIASAAKVVDSEADGRLWGLVNNAGIVVAGPLEFLPIEDFRRQLEVNVTGQVALTQSLLPFIRAATGRIVMIGSIGGRFSAPYSAPYSASKFALEAIADSWRVELGPWGIHVAIVEPGNIKTPIWQKGINDGTELLARLSDEERAELIANYGPEIEAMFDWARKQDGAGIPPSRVARAVEHALISARPKTRYLVGPDARVQAVLARFFPDRVRDRMVMKLLGTPRRK